MVIDSAIPLISVIMPVYNNQAHVQMAVESILSQSVHDFEYVIIDDGSQDESRSILRSFTDPRIRLIENKRNIGIARTLNRGLLLARGRYIARMDADDISCPDRFARQIKLMEAHPDLGVCGSWVYRFDEKQEFILRYPVGTDCVQSFLLFGNPLAHPSVFIRREILEREGLCYAPDCPAAQDYELWNRFCEFCSMDNVSEPLVKWRVNLEGVTVSKFQSSNDVTLRILQRWLGKLNLHVDEAALFFHREVGNGGGVRSFAELAKVAAWLSLLLRANSERKVFPQSGLKAAASFVWFRVCLNSSGLGLELVYRYLRSPFRRGYQPGRQEMAYLLINGLLRLNKAPTGRLGSGRSAVPYVER